MGGVVSLIGPFITTVRVPKPSAALVRASRIEAYRVRGARRTRVTLPDGRRVTFIGPMGKGEAVRQALDHFAHGGRGN